MSTIKYKLGLLATTCGIALTGCGSDDASKAEASRIDVDPKGPLYVVQSAVWTNDVGQGLLYVTDSITGDRTIDPKRGFEVGGESGAVVPIEGVRGFVYGPNDAPVFSRYEISDQGRLEKKGEVNFANTGETFMVPLGPVVDSRLLLFTYPNFKLLELNVDDMTLGKAKTIEGLVDDVYNNTAAGKPVIVDQTAYLGITHRDPDNTTALPGTEALVINLETADYEIIKDDRCNHGRPTLVGDQVWFSSSAASISYRLDGQKGLMGEPCILRLNEDRRAFDPEFIKYFSAWTGGALAGELMVFSETEAFIRVYDEAYAPKEVENQWSYLGAEAWTFGRINPQTADQMIPIDDPRGGGRIDTFDVNGKLWGFNYLEDEQLSILRQYQPSGITDGVTFNGWVFALSRIQ